MTPARRDLRATPVKPEQQDLRVILDRKGCKDLRATPGKPVQEDRRVYKVRKANPDRKDRKVYKVRRDRRATPGKMSTLLEITRI